MTTASAISDDLDQQIRGEVITPSGSDYDEARSTWNGMVDHNPALIARCRGTADVMAAVRFARTHDLPLSVKGGGHGFGGAAIRDNGLVIDLHHMRSVLVDPESRVARVQAGARLGDMDHETQAFGLATTGGVDSRTGVAGLTLGGGLGHLARHHGLALDNVIGLDVVTADGELVRADEDQNKDLFWALRGGGGNFGAVTTFHFQLHQVGPSIAVAQSFHPFAASGEALRFFRDFVSDAPDAIGFLGMFMRVPPAVPFPSEHHGEPALAFIVAHSGDLHDGLKTLQPIADFGDPILSFVDEMPYVALQSSFDAGAPDGMRYYGKSQFLAELPDEAIDTVVDNFEPAPEEMPMVFFESMGGAINRVDRDATAFPHRDAFTNFAAQAGWSDPADDAAIIQWCRELNAKMRPWSTGGVYLNYLDHDEAGRIDEAFKDHLKRLAEIKVEWDPDNVFQGNQPITPIG